MKIVHYKPFFLKSNIIELEVPLIYFIEGINIRYHMFSKTVLQTFTIKLFYFVKIDVIRYFFTVDTMLFLW